MKPESKFCKIIKKISFFDKFNRSQKESVSCFSRFRALFLKEFILKPFNKFQYIFVTRFNCGKNDQSDDSANNLSLLLIKKMLEKVVEEPFKRFELIWPSRRKLVWKFKNEKMKFQSALPEGLSFSREKKMMAWFSSSFKNVLE